jgi:hypothetical protein
MCERKQKEHVRHETFYGVISARVAEVALGHAVDPPTPSQTTSTPAVGHELRRAWAMRRTKGHGDADRTQVSALQSTVWPC